MLRRNLREAYQAAKPTQEQKESMLRSILAQKPEVTASRSRKWKPKGQLGSWLVIIALILALLAGAMYLADCYGLTALAAQKWQQFQAEREATDPANLAQPKPAPTVGSTEPTEPADPYGGIAQTYITAIEEDWQPAQCAEKDISILTSFLESPDQLLYTFLDLDGDGSEELIITDGNVIYDLYGWREELVHPVMGAERNSFRLTRENMIVNVGSNGAASTVYNFYRYSNGYLILDQQVVFDAGKDPEAPWFKGFGDEAITDPITEDQANAIIDSMPAVPIPGTPITEYSPQ